VGEVTELSGFHHVKLPVADLDRSRSWYESVLGLRVEIEFAEGGVVKGLALADSAGSIHLALRHDPARAAALAGFDPIALAVPTRDAVQAWRRRLDELGHPHGGGMTGHKGGSVLVGLHDPDGIEIRLYAD
jgi:catechol 2,3-dioxygenase-like lactoylglutathione lyase family enzyme